MMRIALGVVDFEDDDEEEEKEEKKEDEAKLRQARVKLDKDW